MEATIHFDAGSTARDLYPLTDAGQFACDLSQAIDRDLKHQWQSDEVTVDHAEAVRELLILSAAHPSPHQQTGRDGIRRRRLAEFAAAIEARA